MSVAIKTAAGFFAYAIYSVGYAVIADSGAFEVAFVSGIIGIVLVFVDMAQS